MPDKLRSTQPLKITYSKGEQPQSQKLTAHAEQSRQGALIIEKAIGDLWNDSGEAVTIDYPLQIPNLARMMGANKYLNPAIYPLEYEFTFRENLGNKYTGKTNGKLKFVPSSSSFTGIDTSGQFTNLVAAEYLVGDPEEAGNPNEYYVSTTDGSWRTDNELVANEKLQYTVDPTTWTRWDNTFPGIIPDPRQEEFTSVRVSESNSKFRIHLPPRRPLNFASAAAGDYGPSGGDEDKYPASIDIGLSAGNEATSIALPLKYWQSDTVDALDHEHYRYSLPKEIRDQHSSLAPGASYATGFMYLWDTNTGTIISDVLFSKPSDGETRPWIIEVESSSFDFSAVTSVDESEASYNDTGLVLITCGAPLSRTLQTLATEFRNHAHNNTDSSAMVASISHNALEFLTPGIASNNEHSARYPTYLPRWSPSRWNNDGHTNLLSRAGSHGLVENRYRDPNDNAMLGHLILANSVADSNNVFLDSTNTDGSFNLIFGGITGPGIGGISSSAIGLSIPISAPGNFAVNVIGIPPYGPSSPVTYYYNVVARNAKGEESNLGTEDSYAYTGSSYEYSEFSWDAVPGAVSYRIYRGTSTGVYTHYFDTTLTTIGGLYIFGADPFSSGSPSNPSGQAPRGYSGQIGLDGLEYTELPTGLIVTASGIFNDNLDVTNGITTLANAVDYALVIEGDLGDSTPEALPLRITPLSGNARNTGSVISGNLLAGTIFVGATGRLFIKGLGASGSNPGGNDENGFERVLTKFTHLDDSFYSQADSTSELVVASLEIPAGTLDQYSTIRFHIAGQFNTTSGGGTLTTRVRAARANSSETSTTGLVLLSEAAVISTGGGEDFFFQGRWNVRSFGPTRESFQGIKGYNGNISFQHSVSGGTTSGDWGDKITLYLTIQNTVNSSLVAQVDAFEVDLC